MKKILLLVACVACVSAQALPTYEPFSEFAPTLASNPTNLVVTKIAGGASLGTNATSSLSNCLDLATGGYTAPTGEVWGSLNFNGTGGLPLRGLDTAVVSNSDIFPASSLNGLLPSTFPGFDPDNGITYFAENDEQPYLWNGKTYAASNYVGNSAILKFAQDFTRPTNGIKTLYFSYLFSVAQQGQLGAGNDGRYLSLLAATNLVEGTNVGVVAYTNWSSLFNTFGPSVHYISHGLLQNGGAFYIGACDSMIGKTFNQSTNNTPFTGSYNTPVFVVGAYVMNATNGVPDTNMMWVNPSIYQFGGATPPSSPVHAYAMPFNMSDLGGLVLENRVGVGAAGGVGTNYVANLLIGSTWSYVTGGPEFTTQPVSVSGNFGGTYNFAGQAVAAAQTVSYQWQKVVNGSAFNLSDGAGTAGGNATVSGSTTPTLTITGISSGDLGGYQLVATSSGTGYSLASAPAALTVDPSITAQPQGVFTNYGSTVSFTASASSGKSSTMSFVWLFNGNPLTDSTQPDGSVVSGSQGNIAGNSITSTLTIANVTYQEIGNYTLLASNNVDNATLSAPAGLTINDPFIVTQPTNAVVVAGTTATFSVAASGSSNVQTIQYQWYANGNPLSDGGTASGSTVSGSQTSVLTISGVSDGDAGNYYVSIYGTGSGQTMNSATVKLTVADPVTFLIPPVSRTERVGDHTAFVVKAAGGLLNYQWQFNGANIDGATSTALVLTNIQPTDAGSYTVMVSNPAGLFSASATLNVINSPVLTLSPTNLIVARVGDGVQALSGAKGNTIYLDQYTTNGAYVSTVQVPDENTGQTYGTGSSNSVFGSLALLAQGAGADAPTSMFLTLSGNNQQFLGFAGYCLQYPFSGNDVTAAPSNAFWHGLATVNPFGQYSLAYTNYGLYNGGNHTIRSAVTLDGTEFWTTGQAGTSGVKFVNTADNTYAAGGLIPVVTSSGTGTRVVKIVNGNLVFSDAVGIAGQYGPGIFACNGTPEPGPNGTVTQISQWVPEGGQPNDFAFSPDGQTVYIADSLPWGFGGGIQRWDTNNGSGTFGYSYTLAPLGNGATNGAQGLAVYFPPSITSWGAGVTGAVIFATTFDTATNSLVEIVDNGQDSPSAVIATAGPNQAFRGVSFGPTPAPVAIAQQPQSQTNFPNNNVTFTVGATGSQPIYYQWMFNGAPISGATNSNFTTNMISVASAGNYSVIVSNLAPSSVTSANALLTVNSGAPVIAAPAQSYVEGAGDHVAFATVVAGSTPLYGQWYLNDLNTPLVGATNTYLVLTNIQTSQSGTYILVVSNAYGSAQTSASLTVTPGPVSLSANNLVVARIGDGVQPLSGATGNTLYLDQYTTSGNYVGSIQIPDEGTGRPYGTGSSASTNLPFGSSALLVSGADGQSSDSGLGALLTLSADGLTLNFAGYSLGYPFTGSDVTMSSGNGGIFWRGIGSVNGAGNYSLVYTNTGLYSGNAHLIHAAVRLDQTNYWTTGEAGTPGLKYETINSQPANGGGIISLGGSVAGTRQVRIIGVNGITNIYFTDVGASPAGLYSVNGTPEVAGQSTNLVVAESNSPVDFAISPDGQTIYIADNGAFGGNNAAAGGIQRWDANGGGGYNFSYTLGTGNGSTAGARGLTVDFGTQASWGAGVLGAKLYATTSEASGNRLIKIVDLGSGSAATTIATAGGMNTLSGVSFSPVTLPVIIVSQPQNQTAITGSGAVFSVGVTGTAPFYYQWQFNGTNLPNATDSKLTVDPVQAALPGNYTVVVSNVAPSAVTSAPVSISFVPVLGFNGNGSGWSLNGSGGSGLPVYGYNGGSDIVELTQGVASQYSSTFYQYPVYVGGFLASWTYQVQNPNGPLADGMAFVVENDPSGPNALAGNGKGGSFGYGNPFGITNSAALEFNIYTNSTSGYGIGVDTNGNLGPFLLPSPVVLGSGDPINVTVRYLNGIATVTLFDTVTGDTFTTNAAINIPAAVGGNQAYVGFTGANGAVVSTQTVSNFAYYSLINLTAVKNGNSLTLSWPTGVGGYVLQQSTSLAPANWVNVPNAVSVVNGSNQVVLPASSSGNVFYRLVNP